MTPKPASDETLLEHANRIALVHNTLKAARAMTRSALYTIVRTRMDGATLDHILEGFEQWGLVVTQTDGTIRYSGPR